VDLIRRDWARPFLKKTFDLVQAEVLISSANDLGKHGGRAHREVICHRVVDGANFVGEYRRPL
jgi:hypothetical protein